MIQTDSATGYPQVICLAIQAVSIPSALNHIVILEATKGMHCRRYHLAKCAWFLSSQVSPCMQFSCCLPCRVAAVHGAVYVLQQAIASLLVHPETKQCRGIQTDAGQVNAAWSLVVGTILNFSCVDACPCISCAPLL